MSLGLLLRRYRTEKKLTLKVIAEKVGISEGFLSQVENNVKSPSVDTLMNICQALGVGVGDVFDHLNKEERIVLIRRSEWEEVDFSHTGFATRRFFPPERRTVIDSSLLFLEPGISIPVRKNLKNGQEILCLLQGSLELTQGERIVSMAEGDTVHFWSDPERQAITNTGDRLAVVLWAGTI